MLDFKRIISPTRNDRNNLVIVGTLLGIIVIAMIKYVGFNNMMRIYAGLFIILFLKSKFWGIKK